MPKSHCGFAVPQTSRRAPVRVRHPTSHQNVGGTLIESPMGDARFYARTGPHTLEAIATVAKGTAPAIEKAFSGVTPLQSAGPDQVSFLDNRRYAGALEKTMAGAVIVHPNMLERVPATTIPITTTAAYKPGRASPLCSIPHRLLVPASTPLPLLPKQHA